MDIEREREERENSRTRKKQNPSNKEEKKQDRKKKEQRCGTQQRLVPNDSWASFSYSVSFIQENKDTFRWLFIVFSCQMAMIFLLKTYF